MIEAYFDGRTGLITGAYQYDKGQRLRLNGIPGPDELAEMDDFLSGDLVTVQAHFSRRGDSQAEPRLAVWDEEHWVWIATIPDEYLTKHTEVYVVVHAYYGSDGEQERGKTVYEGVFIPASRTAPNDVVSDDQLDQWAELEQEVEMTLASVERAVSGIQNAADSAQEAGQEAAAAADTASAAAQTAEKARQRLEDMEAFWNGMQISSVELPAGSSATVTRNGNTITFGVPRGADGDKGDAGETGQKDMDISFEDGTLTIIPK